jgi:hypothetical protein
MAKFQKYYIDILSHDSADCSSVTFEKILMMRILSIQNVRPAIPTSCPAPVRLLIEQCWASHPEKRPDFCQIVQILEKFKTVLDRDGTLDNMPSSICQETRDHKNWLAHWVHKLKLSHIMSSVVTSHHLGPVWFQVVKV